MTITLLILCYFLMAFLMSCLIYRVDGSNHTDEGMPIILGLLWPCVVPIAIVGGFISLWHWAMKKVCD